MPISSSLPRLTATTAVLLLAFALAACARQASPVGPSGVSLTPMSFNDLQGWRTDRTEEVLAAFLRHCPALTGGKDVVSVAGQKMDPATWQPVCDAGSALTPGDAGSSRDFFQTWFVPFRVSTAARDEGAFTGYYEAGLNASRTPDSRYTVPVYRRPPDLVTIDLGQFRQELRGRLGARVDGSTLVPYWTRKQIDDGALAGRNLELLWADDPADTYFMEVQGSGRATLPDGSNLALSFDGQNGQPYVALGNLLVERGLMTAEAVSMRSIKAWLHDHPVEGRKLMEDNPSFVFFKEGGTAGPVGTSGTVLTPGRSLAVDPAFTALGLPVWIDVEDQGQSGGTLRRLMLAEDTGSAIRGPIRGDVFWGYGDGAAARAGSMRAIGRMTLLVPKPVAARVATAP